LRAATSGRPYISEKIMTKFKESAIEWHGRKLPSTRKGEDSLGMTGGWKDRREIDLEIIFLQAKN
jgi:hypothetical protein